MNEYKIKQNKYTIGTIKNMGDEVKVFGKKGTYAQGKYEANNNLALFVDDETNTLYRIPINIMT